MTLVSAFLLWWASSGGIFSHSKGVGPGVGNQEQPPLVARPTGGDGDGGDRRISAAALDRPDRGQHFLFARSAGSAGMGGGAGLVDFFIHAGVLLASFGVTVALFLLIYHRLPNRRLRLREALPSALFAAVFLGGGAVDLHSSPSPFQLPAHLRLHRRGGDADDLELLLFADHAARRSSLLSFIAP